MPDAQRPIYDEPPNGPATPGRLRVKALGALLLVGMCASGTRAQEINPDRPDLTTSAEVVPAGAIQIETGFAYERTRVGGSAPVGSERVDFGALLLLTLGLPAGLSLDANAGVAAIGQTRPNGLVPQGIISAALSWAVTERLTAIGELFFATKEERGGRDRLLTTVAVMYRGTPWLALDVGARTTLTGQGPDWAALAGLSVRLGR